MEFDANQKKGLPGFFGYSPRKHQHTPRVYLQQCQASFDVLDEGRWFILLEWLDEPGPQNKAARGKNKYQRLGQPSRSVRFLARGISNIEPGKERIEEERNERRKESLPPMILIFPP